MNIQIIGTRKSNETRKAERYFRERGVTYQFVDLEERPLSPGELTNIAQVVPASDLIDTQSRSYKSRGMQYLEFDAEEVILEDPLVLRMPIVRNGKRVTVGHDAEVWQQWISAPDQ